MNFGHIPLDIEPWGKIIFQYIRKTHQVTIGPRL